MRPTYILDYYGTLLRWEQAAKPFNLFSYTSLWGPFFRDDGPLRWRTGIEKFTQTFRPIMWVLSTDQKLPRFATFSIERPGFCALMQMLMHVFHATLLLSFGGRSVSAAGA